MVSSPALLVYPRIRASQQQAGVILENEMIGSVNLLDNTRTPSVVDHPPGEKVVALKPPRYIRYRYLADTGQGMFEGGRKYVNGQADFRANETISLILVKVEPDIVGMVQTGYCLFVP